MMLLRNTAIINIFEWYHQILLISLKEFNFATLRDKTHLAEEIQNMDFSDQTGKTWKGLNFEDTTASSQSHQTGRR